MTFIASLKVKKGIIQVSDSLELETGAVSRYDDFKKLLDEKKTSEESEELLLSPKELDAIYRGERIKNVDGAKKTFEAFSHGSIQVSGSADINGKDVASIIQTYKESIPEEGELSQDDFVNLFMEILKPNFPDREIEEYEKPELRKERFPDTRFLYSMYDPASNNKYVYDIGYRLNINKKYVYSSVFEGLENDKYYSSGMVGLSYQLSTVINHSNIFRRELTFRQGFQLLKSAMELAILTEKVNYDVIGVGGTINFSIIDKDGFRFFKDEFSLPEDV